MSATHRLVVHGIMKVDEKILVTKRTLEEYGKPNTYGGYYDVPGGGVDKGETPKDAVIRETKEEVNLDIDVEKIIFEDSNYDKEKNIVFTRLAYLCTIKDFSIIKLDENEHSEYKLIKNISELNNEKIVPFLQEILQNRGRYGV